MPNTPDRQTPAKMPRRRLYQFSLRALLIFVTLAGCGFGWLGWRIREAREQQAAVAAIQKLGGYVTYDYQIPYSGTYELRTEPRAPVWLRAVLGDDFFRTVKAVSFYGTSATDSDLECLKPFSELASLCLSPNMTDAGLCSVKRLPGLEDLTLCGTNITDEGLKHLAEFPRLGFLSFYNARLTEAGVEQLKRSTQLVAITLTNTVEPETGWRSLRGALPDCEIWRK